MLGKQIPDTISNPRSNMKAVPSGRMGHWAGRGWLRKGCSSILALGPASAAPFLLLTSTVSPPSPAPPTPSQGKWDILQILKGSHKPWFSATSSLHWGVGWGSENPGHLTSWLLDHFRLDSEPPSHQTEVWLSPDPTGRQELHASSRLFLKTLVA